MLSIFKKAREAYELGSALQRAIERGRKMHPWVSRAKQFRDLEDEVQELRHEVVENRPWRIKEEALDVAVVALRLREGR